MVSLTLIGTPEELNIPYFAMPSPSSKETSWFYPGTKSKPLSELLGGNAYRWVIEKQKIYDIRRICTRNYLPIKTAFYANWLVFFDDEIVDEFMEKFPQYKIESHIEIIKYDLADLQGMINGKLVRGAYDLSKYPPDQRRAAAQRFIELDNQVRHLAERLRYLETAKKLADKWSTEISEKFPKNRGS